jgi:hypothetical protein
MSHWSSGRPVCFPSWETRVQSPGGYLCESGILLLASSYIGDPYMIDHCGLIGGGLHPEPSLGHCTNNVIISLDLTQLFFPVSHLLQRLHNWHSRLLGGSPVKSLQSYCIHTVSLVQWVNPLLPVMRDLGSIPRGYLCETGVLLLVLSHYNFLHTMIGERLTSPTSSNSPPLVENCYKKLDL